MADAHNMHFIKEGGKITLSPGSPTEPGGPEGPEGPEGP